MAVYAIAMARQGGRRHPNQVAMLWTVGCAVLSFVGAGFLGFAHTLPQVNLYTHGTLVTAMHGHLAFWGAYAMIVLGIISYAMPLMTGRKCYEAPSAVLAFWVSNVGMIAMTLAFAVAGVAQVYLERRIGMDFVTVQKEIEVHFYGLILAALLFASGILLFVWNFVSYGLPIDVAAPVRVEDIHAGRHALSARDA
jgi:nitric oxide reductase subunit B